MGVNFVFRDVEVPAWVSALAVNEWTALANTAWSSIDPSPAVGTGDTAKKVDAWNSLVVDTATSRVYSAAAGGHTDYAGNEVDYLDLNRATPTWVSALAPTPTASVTNCSSYYADDRPTSRHHYYGMTFDPVGRRIFLFGGSYWCNTGQPHNAISSYNLDSASYSASTAHGSWNVNGTNYPAVCAVQSTGDVYVVHGLQVGRFVPSTNTWTTNLSASGTAIDGLYACSAYDSTRGRMFILGGESALNHTYTVATNTLASQTLSGAASGSVKGNERAMFYCATLDAFFVRGSAAGGTVYKIDASTFECTSLSTTGGGSVPVTTNGPFNRFNYVPALGVAIYVPVHNGNVWALRLH